MTNKEAIEQLKWVQKRICDITYSPESFEAINLAIKALGEIGQIKTLFDEANDADDFYHELRVLFEMADNEM